MDEALLALSDVLDFGGSWNEAQDWGSGFLHMSGELGDSNVALRLSWAETECPILTVSFFVSM